MQLHLDRDASFHNIVAMLLSNAVEMTRKSAFFSLHKS